MNRITRLFLNIAHFSRFVIGRRLRRYQLRPAQAIVESVLNHKGLSFAVMMPRQAGKNELSAHLECYMMNLCHRVGGQIVKATPTFRPQALISKMRLKSVLSNPWNSHFPRSRGEGDYIVSLGKTHCVFLSAQPTANVVGQTASILLECDEAQDVDEEKWYRDFAPMAASTNATTVFYGTAWTSRTLLAKVVRDLRRLEADGIQRVFVVPWEQVAEENPDYKRYVERQIQRLGRNHPLIRTQYFLEEIDAEGGMFPEHRQAQMRGTHARQPEAQENKIYALLLDVAGEDEMGIGMPNRRRDSTALTIVEVDLSSCDDPLIGFPTYRVVNRREWIGTPHVQLYVTLVDLAINVWKARYLVVDATGVGAGLTSFLVRALGDDVVRPFVFTAASKSQLGWDFLAICDTGRFKDHTFDLGNRQQRRFWQQVEAANYKISDGPERRMRWGVQDPDTHDDLLISAALCAVLDKQSWRIYQQSAMIEAQDVLHEIDQSREF
jgi:hypothetical protein